MEDSGEAGGAFEPDATEQVWAGWAGGGGHGLEVGPGGLLDEAVADGDLVAGGGGVGRRGLDGGEGGGGEEVLEGGVGLGAFEGEKLQVELRRAVARRCGGAAVLGWEAAAVAGLVGGSGGGGG